MDKTRGTPNQCQGVWRVNQYVAPGNGIEWFVGPKGAKIRLQEANLRERVFARAHGGDRQGGRINIDTEDASR
jgi:hypothetical protein